MNSKSAPPNPPKPSQASSAPVAAPAGVDELTLEAYRQASEDFRQLNQIFWQAPGIVITITGGLGIAIATQDLDIRLERGMLFFAAFVNLIWIVVLTRLRLGVMSHLLQRSRDMTHNVTARNPNRRWEHLILILFSVLLGCTALSCVAAGIFHEQLFPVREHRNSQFIDIDGKRYRLIPIEEKQTAEKKRSQTTASSPPDTETSPPFDK